MILSSSQVILFGIQAGVQLHAAARQAYIEKTRERELLLPLPGVPHAPTIGKAANFFRGEGHEYLETNDRLRVLDPPAQANPRGFKESRPGEAAEYLELFKVYKSLHTNSRTSDGVFSANDVLVITTISQWRENETPHPTAIKRIAGVLIEIGIDYFASGPGKITGETPEKRVLRDLVNALDDHTFSSYGLEGTIEKIFVATLDSLAENPELVSGDAQTRMFISSLAKGIVEDVNTRLTELDEGERLFETSHLGDTAEIVFRSVIRTSAEIVLESPGDFLSIDEADQAALVTRVGTSVLDAILPSVESPIDLSNLFTQTSLDAVMRSALSVVVDYPELLDLDGDKRTGLRKIVEEIAEALLERSSLLGSDMFPELVRLVLDRTAANLHQLWVADGDEEHLLVTAVAALLDELAVESEDGISWGFNLGKGRVIAVAEVVLEEVLQNPSIIISRVGGRPALSAAIQAVLSELSVLELGSLTAETASRLVGTAIRAAAARLDLLDRFRDANGTLKPAVAHVVEAILATAFYRDEEYARSAWMLARTSVLEEMTSIAFERLAESGVDRERIEILRTVLAEIVNAIESKQAFSVARFDTLLSERLGLVT